MPALVVIRLVGLNIVNPQIFGHLLVQPTSNHLKHGLGFASCKFVK